MMSPEDIAEKLESAIKLGDFTLVRNLIDSITLVKDIRAIEAKFSDRDPLVLSLECREETIALYLVEKGFNHRLFYTWSGQQCDQWCVTEHGDDPCPTEYDALKLAQVKNMLKVAKVLSDIRAGLRKPGDGLALMQHPGIKREDSSVSNKRITSVVSTDGLTECGAARRRLKELGLSLHTPQGDSVIHMCVTAPLAHVAASLRVNINAQNFNGDSALHQAVKHEDTQVAQALLINGADPTLRNKLGQTPLDLCSGRMRSILEPFRSGLVQTLNRGESGSLQRLLKLWINPFSVVTRDGKTGLELAKTKRNESQGHTKCYNSLLAASKTLEVTHAVLSEDMPTLKRVLRTETGWCLNSRFKDKRGRTVLSCAIEQNNLEIAQLLVETEQCQVNIRVREHQDTDATLPLIFKTLAQDCSTDTWSYLDHHCDCYQATERDWFGNTALLRAILNGKPAAFIQRILRRYHSAIFHRNADGLNARELAIDLERQDIVDVIDNFVVSQGGTTFVLELPVNFYGQENVNVFDEDKRSLLLVAEQGTGPWRDHAIKSVIDYTQLEALGTKLHKYATQGKLKRVAKLNTANYRDRNGYTALIRAIVFEQLEVAEVLITERPVLKQIPDNCNRYPLHYAYALPAKHGEPFVRLLLQRNPEDIEGRLDCRGREPVEYKELREGAEILKMLHEARTLDTQGQVGPPLWVLPEGAITPEQLMQASLQLQLDEEMSRDTSQAS